MSNKTKITDEVGRRVAGITRKQASEAVDCVFDCLSDSLAGGERVQVAGFGTFSVSERAARQGVNPATGERLHIAASKGVRFKPGKDLKDRVNR